MNFWRGEAYSKYFDFLDATGGFYYEVRHPATLIAAQHVLCFARQVTYLSPNSDGEMHRCIALLLRSSRGRTRFTSSMTLDTSTTLTLIAREGMMCGRKTSVPVTKVATSVRNPLFRIGCYMYTPAHSFRYTRRLRRLFLHASMG